MVLVVTGVSPPTRRLPPLHCEDAVGGGLRFSQSISALIELFSTIGHKGAEYPGQRSVEQGAAQYSTVQYRGRRSTYRGFVARRGTMARPPSPETRGRGAGDNEAATYTPIYHPVAVSSVRSPH